MNRPLARPCACLALCALLVAACGQREPGEPVLVAGAGPGNLPSAPARYLTVIAEGCRPNDWQLRALESTGMRRAVRTVVLLCPTARESGDVYPQASEAAALGAALQRLHTLGYRVTLALALSDGLGNPYAPLPAAAMVQSPAWRERVVQQLLALPGEPDGYEVSLPVPIANSARTAVTALVSGLSRAALALRPAAEIGVFAPPSLASPSDLPGGDAFDLPALAPYVHHFRLMTLDFSTCFPAPFCVSPPPPGPTIDVGWAVDAVSFARSLGVPAARLEVSLPLYGHDYAGGLDDYAVDYVEALGLAAYYHATVFREPSGTRHFTYTNHAGQPREVWFDDRYSLLRAMSAWNYGLIDRDVGVTFYGLGAEDPELWNALHTQSVGRR